MADIQPHNHLKDSFYTTPKFARQMMTLKQWKETCLATDGRILACGETYELHASSRGGGMYEVRARPNYWQNGKPKKAVKEQTSG